jgi:hypothetical protein
VTNIQWISNATYVDNIESVIYLNMVEDTFSTGTVGTLTYIAIVGGITAAKTYGLGNWWNYVERFD